MSNLFSDFVEKNKDNYRKLRINNGVPESARRNTNAAYPTLGKMNYRDRSNGSDKVVNQSSRNGLGAFAGLFDNVADSARKAVTGANTALDRIKRQQQESTSQNQNSFASLFGADQQSMIDDLLNNEYMVPRSAEEISAFARQGADEELAELMGVLDRIMGAARGRYEESDSNLESMYNAHQNDIRTNGVANQKAITDTARDATQEAADSSVESLQNAQAQQDKSRSAMLENLGIQAAAAAPDEYNALAEAQGQIQQGNARSQNRINEMGAANEAAMSRMAETVGLEGSGQRSALERQFGQFGNEIDMQRAQYQQQHAEAMRNLMMQAEAMANQERQQYGQFQYGIGTDMLNSELDYVTGRAQSQAEAAQAQQEFEQRMALLDREYEHKNRIGQQDTGSTFNPMEQTFKAMLGQDGVDPQEALQWYLEQMNRR